MLKTRFVHPMLALVACVLGCNAASPNLPSDDGGGGGDATEGAAPTCDGRGAPAIPAGFPPLGGNCLAHFSYHEERVDLANHVIEATTDQDYAADRGVRALKTSDFSGFDLGIHQAPDIPVAFFLPRLDLGVYRRADGAEIWSGDIGSISEYYTAVYCGQLRLEIVGSAGGAIWGRFVSDGYDAEGLTLLHITQGRFAAKLEDAPSAGELGTPWIHPVPDPIECAAPYDLCGTTTDCPPARAACVVVSCGQGAYGLTQGYCHDDPVDSSCPAQERCDPQQGCVPM